MRYLALSIFLIFSVGLAAQEKEPLVLRHTWLVGGNAKLFVEKIGAETGRLVVEIDPQAGYFFSESLAAGFRVPLSFTSDAIRVGTNPFVRYYLPTKSNVRPFAEVNGGRSWRYIYDLQTEAYVLQNKNWLIGTQLGAAFFLGNKASIDLYFYYTGQDGKTISQGHEIDAPFYHVFGLGGGFLVYL